MLENQLPAVTPTVDQSNWVNLYYTRIPNSRFIFRNGNAANFRGTQFTTKNPSEIAELDEEIRLGHPTIYVMKGAERIDPKSLDPYEVLKARIIREYLEQQAQVRDMGNTPAPVITPASSTSIAPTAAGGSGVQMFAAPRGAPVTPFDPNLKPAPQMPSSLQAALGLVTPDVFAQTPLEAASMNPAPSERGVGINPPADPDARAGARAMSAFDVPLVPVPNPPTATPL